MNPTIPTAWLTLIGSATQVDTAQVQITLRPALEHQSNQLYDVRVAGRHLILKEFLRADEFDHAPPHEFYALKLLAPLDIAPQPLWYEAGERPFVLYEFLPGMMWDRRQPSAHELGQLAEIWRLLHNLPTDGLWPSTGFHQPLPAVAARFRTQFQRYEAWAATHFPPAQHAANLCLEALERHQPVVEALSNLPPVLRFSKADSRFANIIARPDGRLGLIDWEDSGLRDPARDLADLITHANQEDLLDFAAWQPFLKPYLAARSQDDPQIEQRMHLYLAIFPIFWIYVIIGVGMKRSTTEGFAGWTANELPVNVRLRRYLARALAWPNLDFSTELATLADVEFFPSDETTRA